MKKVLLFLFALLGLGASGVWADVTVTFVDGTNVPYDTYGTRNTSVSPNTLTTNANSGCAGVVLSAPVIDRATWWSTCCLALKPNATQTDEAVSITAPAGYLITSLSMTLRANSSSFPYDVVFDGNTTTVTGARDFAFSKDRIKVKSFAFTINHTAENFDGTNKWLAVKAMTVTLAPINFVSLTFDRSSNGVTVNVKDADGDAIPGVTASLESTSFTAFMTGSAAALSRETNSVLAPAQNSGYANSQDASITYTFKVEGLSGFTYSKAALDVYAMTGGGGAQNNGGDTQREWTFDIAIGTAADATTSFVNQTGNDICTVSDTDGGLHHKLWTMAGSDGTATDALYIVVTLTKTASLGCFAGIGELQLFKPGSTVQYVISDASGPIYTSDPVVTIPGETINTLPSALQREFCEYEVTPTEIVAGENTVNVTVTYNTPFEISPSYDNAKWYYLKLKDATFVTYSSSGTPNVTLPNSYTMGDANAQWAFIGDAYNGFSIVNKAAGDAMVLGSASPKNDGNTGANTYATLGSGQDYEKYFPKSSNHVSNGFYLFTSEGYAMNQRSTDNLAYWTGGYDKGSTFSVVEVVDDYSEDVANEITPWFTSYGNYFQLKASVVEANQAKYEAALVQCNLETFNELKALIDNTANYVYPATGNYRIKSSGSRIGESYIGYGQPSSASAGLITVKAENAITDASTIITLTGANGEYTISTQGKYAKNQTSNNVAFPMTDNAEEAATFYFIPYTPGVVVITNDYSTQGYFHESNWAIPGVVRWTAASTASHWTIEELPAVTVDVTYDLYVGEEKVNTVVAEAVAANSAVSIPASLISGYDSDYYTFTTNGTIGEENCTITVTGTLIYSDVVYPYTNISNSKSYYIKTRNGERDALSTYTVDGTTYLASPVKQALGIAPKPFAILNYEGNYYLYSVEDKKFVTYSAEQAAPLADVITGTSDRVTFSPTLAPLYELRFDGSSSKIINSSSSYTYGIVINRWGSSTGEWDEGCQYSIDEAEDFDPTEALAVLEEFFHPSYTVTYVVKDADDNTLFTSDPVGTTLGATITELPAEYQMGAFYTYNTVDITVSDLNTTASFIATPKENPLVKYTADATSPVWYKLKLKDANYPTYVANVAEGEYNVQTPTTANDDATTYQWAFIGEPYAGFQMINCAAGTSLVLGSATTIGISDTGASVKATLAAPGTQARELWYLSPSSYLTGGFFLFNADGHALNQRGPGFLAYWTSGADLGSTFTVTEVHEGEALFNDLIAQLKAYPYGAGVNQYSMIVEGNDYTSQASSIISNLETADCTDETLATAQLLIDGTTLNLPPAGFYRIKGYSGNYITSNTAGSNAAMNGTASANNIVYYSAEKNLVFFGSGYGLYNTSIVAPAGSTLNTYEFMQGAQIGKYYVKSNASSGIGTYCYDNTANGTKVDRNGAPVTSGSYQTDWTLEAVTTLPVTISTAKYATLYAPVALTIPDGVTAYYVSALSKTEATLAPISNTIPANTGVILYAADVTEETTFDFEIADEADAINGNKLAGKVAAWEVQDGEAYTLRRSAEDETQVGLFMKEAGTLVGFKAYMPATPAVQMGEGVKGFVFNFDNLTTGIVKMADGTLKLEGAPVYDLSGRKVAAPTKGIYVVKGKKVAIK